MLITTNCSNLCCFIFDIQMIFNFEKSKHLCKMILNMFMGEIICSHMVWYWRVVSGVVTEMGTCAVLLVPCAVENCCWSSQQIDGLGHLVPKSQVHGTNMGPTWVLSATCGPHVGPINLVIGVCCCSNIRSHQVPVLVTTQMGSKQKHCGMSKCFPISQCCDQGL